MASCSQSPVFLEEYERFKSIGIEEKREPDNTCNPAPAKPFTV
jgi:hypothetical protein